MKSTSSTSSQIARVHAFSAGQQVAACKELVSRFLKSAQLLKVGVAEKKALIASFCAGLRARVRARV